VLNFWAAWCEPCRRELPAFERLAAALKGKPVIVLLVNIGSSRDSDH
jgi:thiol-disulfide isomerase/thioredoxin